MLFSLIKRLQNDVLAFQTDYSIPVWDNIFELFEIIENYIFYEPTEPSQSSKNKKKMTSKSERNKKIGIHLYDDGSCQDIILVDEIMDLFDHKIDIPTPIGSEKKNTTSSKMTESILKGLIQERDFYKNVKSFMVGLENAKISDKDNLVVIYVAFYHKFLCLLTFALEKIIPITFA